jgi:hypothetical protein
MKPVHKLHNISAITQQTESSHCKSLLHHTQKKINIELENK